MNAFIFDHVRASCGRCRAGGSIRDVPAIQLAVHVLEALRARRELGTALLDDVVMGCAQAAGEQCGNIARSAVVTAGYAETVAGT